MADSGVFSPPPTPRPTIEERKNALAEAPFIRRLNEPIVGGCSAELKITTIKRRKCKRSAQFEYRPVNSNKWIPFCWEHTFSRGILKWPEDMHRFDKWVEKHPPKWRTPDDSATS